MADDLSTGLEKQENAVFGNGSPIGGTVDHVLLDGATINTNKVTAGARQSELRIAWLMFHDALVARDNVLDKDGLGINDHIKHYREEPDGDPKAHRTIRVYFKIDYWAWMIPVIDDKVITHQLTLWGYSREQFLKHSADIASVNQRQIEGGGMWQQLQQVFK